MVLHKKGHGLTLNGKIRKVKPSLQVYSIDNVFELMTESEVIQFLRIPEISNSKDYHNVIENLKRVRGLPRIHIYRKVLYPKKAVLE